MNKGPTKVGKMIMLFFVAIIILPVFIGIAPFIMLKFFKGFVDMGVFIMLMLVSLFLIIVFFIIRVVVKKTKGAYDKLSGKQDWRDNLTEQDIRARKRAEDMLRK